MAKEGSSGTEGVLLTQQDDEHDVFLSNSRVHHLCLWCYVVLCGATEPGTDLTIGLGGR
jgi:hypothetical protein